MFVLAVAAAIVTAGCARPQAGTREAGTRELAPPVPVAPGGERARRRTIDLRQEVAAALDRLAALAGKHSVRLESAIMPGVTMRADPTVLQNVLMETIAGAVRAAEGGRVLVAVFSDPDAIEITVTDDGPVRNDASRDVELRVVAAFLAVHGGTVMVDARRGRGTTVALRLPAEAARATTVSTPAPDRVGSA